MTFRCTVFHGAKVEWSEGVYQLDGLDENVSFFSESPITLNEPMRLGLGDYAIRDLDVPVAFMLSKESAESGSYDRLEDRHAVWRVALLLKNCLAHTEGHAFFGQASGSGPLVPNGHQWLEPMSRHKDLAPTKLCATVVQQAVVIAQGMLRVFPSPIPIVPRGHQRNFERLQRGFYALFRALHAHEGIARLHDFVRALDAIFHLPQGRARRTFLERGPLLVGDGENEQVALGELYDIRSAHEHLNDWEADLGVSFGRATVRSLQAEVLTCEVYSRIFSRPELADAFLTDSTTDAFWHRSDRQTLWGDPIDVAPTALKGLVYSHLTYCSD